MFSNALQDAPLLQSVAKAMCLRVRKRVQEIRSRFCVAAGTDDPIHVDPPLPTASPGHLEKQNIVRE